MADKYAPHPDDSAKKVHEIHLKLIADQQAANKKAREDAKKHNPAEVATPHENPPASEVNEAPGGNEAAAGSATPSEGGPGK